MKKFNPVYLFISILEGMLSGAYIYLGKRDRDPMNMLLGCSWLAVSFFHGIFSFGVFDEDTEDEEYICGLMEDEEYD